MDDLVNRALAVYGRHWWNANNRKCACGIPFDATLEDSNAHAEHRMRRVLAETAEHNTVQEVDSVALESMISGFVRYFGPITKPRPVDEGDWVEAFTEALAAANITVVQS